MGRNKIEIKAIENIKERMVKQFIKPVTENIPEEKSWIIEESF